MREPIYLDHHATTPVDEAVIEAMLPYFRERFGNASSRHHAYGWRAELAVERAREEVAALIGARDAKEIVFTSGATEANNLAIAGICTETTDHIVSLPTEHVSVLDAVRRHPHTLVSVNASGIVDAEAVGRAITSASVLVSAMLASNEIGVIQPVAAIAEVAHTRALWLHSDLTQAAGKIPVDVHALGVDLGSLAAHKIHGPKGVGALFVRRSRPQPRLQPQSFGGGHERGLRAGTLNVPGIVGFGVAARLALQRLHADGERLLALRERLRERLFAGIPALLLNGDLAARLPGNLNVSVPGVEGESLLLEVSKSVALSSGSACASADLAPSHVLLALGRSAALAHASLRFGLGRTNTEAEIDAAADAVIAAVSRLRGERC